MIVNVSSIATFYALDLARQMARLGHLGKFYTGRTFEIPACGGFILAEKTDDYLKLFEEGKEAEYFDNVVELREKVDYYLRHDDERQRIAQVGHQRALTSRYTDMESVRRVIQVFQEMAN